MRFHEMDEAEKAYIQKLTALIGLNPTKVRVHGSYVRFGRERACDLDMKETAGKNDITPYIRKLWNSRQAFQAFHAHFDVEDPRIRSTMQSLGHLDSSLVPRDCNPVIAPTLPDAIRGEAERLAQKYREQPTLSNYLSLFSYLEQHRRPVWSLEDLMKERKESNGWVWKLPTMNYRSLYVEVVVDDYPASNIVFFRKPREPPEPHQAKLRKIVVGNEIDYYGLLGVVQLFLKNRNAEELRQKVAETRYRLGGLMRKVCAERLRLDKAPDAIAKATQRAKQHQDELNRKSREFYERNVPVLRPLQFWAAL